MTPERVLAAADAVLMAPPPRGWLDCGLASDLVLTQAGFPPPMGAVAKEYNTPLQLFRRIRAHGGWHDHFAAVVEGNGYRPSSPKTGAIGYTTSNDRRFGHLVAVCAKPDLWVAPVLGGYVIYKEMSAVWAYH